MEEQVLSEKQHDAVLYALKDGSEEGEAGGGGEGKAPPEEPTAYTLPKLVDLQPVRGSPERGRKETLDIAVP